MTSFPGIPTVGIRAPAHHPQRVVLKADVCMYIVHAILNCTDPSFVWYADRTIIGPGWITRTDQQTSSLSPPPLSPPSLDAPLPQHPVFSIAGSECRTPRAPFRQPARLSPRCSGPASGVWRSPVVAVDLQGVQRPFHIPRRR